jgi:predicted transcriptional regulator
MKHIDEQIEKIYNLRMNRGISRSDLAKKAGVSQQQIAKILDSV